MTDPATAIREARETLHRMAGRYSDFPEAFAALTELEQQQADALRQLVEMRERMVAAERERDQLADTLHAIATLRLDEKLADPASCHDARRKMQNLARAALDRHTP